MPALRLALRWGVLVLALAGVIWASLEYVAWQKDRQEAALVARAVRYAVEQFTPAYLNYIRKERQAPRDNMDLGLPPPRDTLWVGLSRAELYANGDLHVEYAVDDRKRQPLLVWHIDERDNVLAGARVCGARDIPTRVLAWNGLDCDSDVAVPAPDAPVPALRILMATARAVSLVDEILDAVRKDDAATLTALRDAGRDLCAASPEKLTALGEAARGAQLKVIPILAAACDVNQIEPLNNRTPLMLAAAAHNPEPVQALLVAGADANIRNAEGDTAWFVLGTDSDSGSQRIRAMLTARGADLDARAPDGTTLLMRAAQAGNVELAGWLLQSGAHIDLQDPAGRSAVMHATLSSRGLEVLQLLATRRANLTLRDTAGKTALQLAREIPGPRSREAAEILRAAGAKN